MSRDELIELARRAGIDPNWIKRVPELPDFLERFAALVEVAATQKGKNQ